MPMYSSAAGATAATKSAVTGSTGSTSPAVKNIVYDANGRMTCQSQSSNTILYALCRRARRATLSTYSIPAAPNTSTTVATCAPLGQGALSMAERSSAAQKCTTIGDPNAAPPASPAVPESGDSAMSAITTNWSPVSAAPADPMIM